MAYSSLNHCKKYKEIIDIDFRLNEVKDDLLIIKARLERNRQNDSEKLNYKEKEAHRVMAELELTVREPLDKEVDRQLKRLNNMLGQEQRGIKCWCFKCSGHYVDKQKALTRRREEKGIDKLRTQRALSQNSAVE